MSLLISHFKIIICLDNDNRIRIFELTYFEIYSNQILNFNFLFSFDLSVLKYKWFLMLLNLFWGVKWSEKEQELCVEPHISFFALWCLPFSDFSSEVSPFLICKKWGKNVHMRMIITQEWPYGKHDEIFTCYFRVKLLVLESCAVCLATFKVNVSCSQSSVTVIPWPLFSEEFEVNTHRHFFWAHEAKSGRSILLKKQTKH